MAIDDVARCLMAMDDDGLRRRVAHGDVDGLDATGLTEEERELLVSAAQDDAETIGFGMQIEAIRPGDPTGPGMQIVPLRPEDTSGDFATSSGLVGALRYARGSGYPGFGHFSQAKLAQGGVW